MVEQRVRVRVSGTDWLRMKKVVGGEHMISFRWQASWVGSVLEGVLEMEAEVTPQVARKKEEGSACQALCSSVATIQNHITVLI